MKRVIFFVISLVLLCTIFTPVVSLAAEIGAEVSAEGTYQDIFTRIYEFAVENKSEVISAAGSLALLVVSGVTKSLVNKKNKEVMDALKIIGGDAAGTASSQGSVISAVNTMAAGYNEMREAYEKYEAVEDDRNRLVGACLVTNTALLEILSRVYVHNKNMPQGVKDVVMLIYTNAQKALSDDEVLRDVVESVKTKISIAPEEATKDEKQD